MDKAEPKHIYAEKKILESLRRLEIDDKISGERTLAKEFRISYMTARKAVDNLVTKGILYRVPKKGTFVADRRAVARETKNIGYFLDSSIKDGLSSPYYSMIFNALEKEAKESGYSLMYFTDISGPDALKKLEKIDGAVISCFPRIEKLIHEVKDMVPVVCIDNGSADKSIPAVTIDNFNAMVDAVKYLCSLGHERIGFITGLADSNVGKDRLAGYLSALKSCGLGEDTDLVYKGDYTFETGEAGADYFMSLDMPPTAIMCANDTMAIGVIRELRLEGLSTPEDISVMGFDNIAITSQMTPAMTTVAAPVGEIARHSIKILDSLVKDIEPDNRHITLPCKLVLRDTCTASNNSALAAGNPQAMDKASLMASQFRKKES